MKIAVEAFKLLSPRERRQSFILLAVMLAMAIADLVGMVSVMPFLAVIANPEMVRQNPFINRLYETGGFSSLDDFLYFLGIASFGLILTAAVVRVVGQYVVNRFTQMRAHSIGQRLLETFLRQPYSFYLGRHSGDMAKGLLSEVNQLISQVYQPLSQIFAQSITLIAMLVLLVAVDPIVAVTMAGVIGGAYVLVYMTVRRYLGRIGQERITANKRRYKIVQEVLGGIKAVKVLAREAYYLRRFSENSRRLAMYQSTNATVSQVPRYLIEAIAFGGIILLTLGLMARYGGAGSGALGQVLPVLGLYAFAAYRMLPAIQALYAALTNLRFGAATLKSIGEDLALGAGLPELAMEPARPLKTTTGVSFRDITFTFAGDRNSGVRDVNLSVPKGTTLGIVGATGAGKTTLVDVFLGLLQPETGQVYADETPITGENVRAWQADLGYVPQDIFLVDASVWENVALGIPSQAIDREQVRNCCRMAQILDFVENELPEGFETKVGERGVRMSGGQRQRIGIARALYHEPDIIVFDEATSALDTLTEQEVMRAVAALSRQKTVIMIAHRLSTVRDCDQIAVLDKGRLVACGTYDELYETSPVFRRLVNAREAA